MSMTLPKQPGASLRVVDHPIARRPLARLGRRLHRTEFPDPQRPLPRLAHVRRQADRVSRLPDHPGQLRGLAGRASSLRSLLQLLQPQCLDRGVLGPSGRCGGRPGAEPDGPALPGGGRHPAAQARQEGLRLGLVPRCGRLDRQAGRHRLGEQLGGHGAGHPHPVCPDQILCLPLSARLHLPGEAGRRAVWTWRRRCSPRSSAGSPIDRSC